MSKQKKKKGCGCLCSLFILAGLVIPFWVVTLPLCWGIAAVIYKMDNSD